MNIKFTYIACLVITASKPVPVCVQTHLFSLFTKWRSTASKPSNKDSKTSACRNDISVGSRNVWKTVYLNANSNRACEMSLMLPTFHLRLGHLLMSLRYSVPLDVIAEFRSANSSSGPSLLCSSVVAVATATAATAASSSTAALMLIWLHSTALARLSQKRIIIAS